MIIDWQQKYPNKGGVISNNTRFTDYFLTFFKAAYMEAMILKKQQNNKPAIASLTPC